jgi:hypothetical protein
MEYKETTSFPLYDVRSAIYNIPSDSFGSFATVSNTNNPGRFTASLRWSNMTSSLFVVATDGLCGMMNLCS